MAKSKKSTTKNSDTSKTVKNIRAAAFVVKTATETPASILKKCQDVVNKVAKENTGKTTDRFGISFDHHGLKYLMEAEMVGNVFVGLVGLPAYGGVQPLVFDIPNKKCTPVTKNPKVGVGPACAFLYDTEKSVGLLESGSNAFNGHLFTKIIESVVGVSDCQLAEAIEAKNLWESKAKKHNDYRVTTVKVKIHDPQLKKIVCDSLDIPNPNDGGSMILEFHPQRAGTLPENMLARFKALAPLKKDQAKAAFAPITGSGTVVHDLKETLFVVALPGDIIANERPFSVRKKELLAAWSEHGEDIRDLV